MDTWAVDSPDGAPREPFFYLTHGAGGDLSSGGLKAMGTALAAHGHLCVRANLPYRVAGRKSPPAAERSVPGFLEEFEKAKSELGPDAVWVAGGRSYGGRVASLAAAEGLEAAGLIFFPYPLHRPGDPGDPRVGHWPGISSPSLFIQGTKDPFCDMEVLRRELPALGAEATLVVVEGGDHSLKVRGDKASSLPSKSEAAVIQELLGDMWRWLSTLP